MGKGRDLAEFITEQAKYHDGYARILEALRPAAEEWVRMMNAIDLLKLGPQLPYRLAFDDRRKRKARRIARLLTTDTHR